MKSKLNKLLALCMEINSIDGYDAFFDYSGHVKTVSVRVNKDADYSRNGDHGMVYNKYSYIKDNHLSVTQLDTLLKEVELFLEGIK